MNHSSPIIISMEKTEEKIVTFFRKHQRMPGYKELLSITGFRSKNAVWKLIRRLVAKKFLSKGEDGKITLAKESQGVSLLGLVEAGFPTPAEETNLERITLDEWLRFNWIASFML